MHRVRFVAQTLLRGLGLLGLAVVGGLTGLAIYAAAGLLDSPPAHANEPTAGSDKVAREVVGSGWFGVIAPASATAPTCFASDGGGSALFPWNVTVVTTCTGRAYACWLQDDAAFTMATTGFLTDGSSAAGSGPDGSGPCWELPANIPTTKRNPKSVFTASTQVGRRSGACLLSGVATGAPCDADADSDCGVGETCDTGGDRWGWTTGAYLCITDVSGSGISCSTNTEVQ